MASIWGTPQKIIVGNDGSINMELWLKFNSHKKDIWHCNDVVILDKKVVDDTIILRAVQHLTNDERNKNKQCQTCKHDTLDCSYFQIKDAQKNKCKQLGNAATHISKEQFDILILPNRENICT